MVDRWCDEWTSLDLRKSHPMWHLPARCRGPRPKTGALQPQPTLAGASPPPPKAPPPTPKQRNKAASPGDNATPATPPAARRRAPRPQPAQAFFLSHMLSCSTAHLRERRPVLGVPSASTVSSFSPSPPATPTPATSAEKHRVDLGGLRSGLRVDLGGLTLDLRNSHPMWVVVGGPRGRG